MGFAGASVAAVLILLASLTHTEGRRYVPYLDVFGVLTVCKGVTGEDVIADKVYTPPECDVLETAYVQRMYVRLGKCVARTDLELHQVVAWGHFAYNVGEGAFCASTAAKLLNVKADPEACEQVMRWTYGRSRITGKRLDCSIRANKCYGLYDRRVRERAMCKGDMNAFKPEWKAAA